VGDFRQHVGFRLAILEFVRKLSGGKAQGPVGSEAVPVGKVSMSDRSETPFDSIEGSHEYVAMLAEAIEEARQDVEAEIALAEQEGAERRKEALLLVSFNLAKLDLQIKSSRRILNDLRSLRRLLLSERQAPRAHRSAAAE
jgi:hypothetical protein